MGQHTISKRQKKIIQEVILRWQETVTAGTPNVEMAKECLRAGYENGIGAWRRRNSKSGNITFFTAESPVQFGLATAIIRGRLSKEKARAFCEAYSIDPAFIKPLRRDKPVSWNSKIRDRWWRSTSEFSRTWQRVANEAFANREEIAATIVGTNATTWRQRTNDTNARQLLSTNAPSLWLTLFRSVVQDTTGPLATDTRFGAIVSAPMFPHVWGAMILDSPSTMATRGDLNAAYSESQVFPNDLDLVNRWNNVFLDYSQSAVDAEILCRMLNIKSMLHRWEHEVYHHLTNFACFSKSCVILAARPTMQLNEAGEIHNESGPAVTWADGTRLWFLDGHMLDEGGRIIIEKPRELSVEKILRIRNEETRRVAIDKYDLEHFIVESGCPILDHRENALDNTIEILVGPPEQEQWGSKRMVLFCRSTGRRYLLGVPREIESCADGQKWLAGGGADRRLPYANRELNLLGAT